MKRLLIGTALACLALPVLAQGLPKVPVYHTDEGKAVAEEPLLADMHERFRDVREGPGGAVYVLMDSGGTAIGDDMPATAKLLKLTPK